MAYLRISVALLPLLVLAAACGGSSGKSNRGIQFPAPTPTPVIFPLTVTQSDTQQLRLAEAPQRIVSLSRSGTEIFCETGGASQLVAVEKQSNCPIGSKAKPELDAATPNIEELRNLQPGLIYIDTNQGRLVDQLRQLGLPVLYLTPPDSLDALLKQIELLGKVSGNIDEAAALLTPLRVQIDAMKAELQKVTTGPRVYHELDGNYGTVGPGSYTADLYKFLKAENIVSGTASPNVRLSSEAIIRSNPQVIVLAKEISEGGVQALLTRPGWDQIDAVKNGRICQIEPSLVNVPGARLAEGLKALASCLYPDRFR